MPAIVALLLTVGCISKPKTKVPEGGHDVSLEVAGETVARPADAAGDGTVARGDWEEDIPAQRVDVAEDVPPELPPQAEIDVETAGELLEELSIEDVCVPQCTGTPECGEPDGCGGVCPGCGDGYACVEGVCEVSGGECEDGNDQSWDGCTGGYLSESLVNSYVSDHQRLPDVAPLDDGGYVFVWESCPFPLDALEKGQDGSGCGVFGQRFDSDGLALGPEFQVNQNPDDHQRAPAVAGFPGGYVVAWRGWSTALDEWHLYARIYDAEEGSADDEVQLSQAALFEKARPAVSAYADGRFVAIWDEAGTTTPSVVGRVFTADGTAAGEGLQLQAESKEGLPAVAVLDDQKFAVLWELMTDSWGIDVFGQVLQYDGAEVGNQFVVPKMRPENQTNPGVARVADDKFLAGYASQASDGDGSGAVIRLFNSLGVPQSGEMFANTYLPGDQDFVGVALLAGGDFVTVWHGPGPGDEDKLGIYAQVFTPVLVKQGGELHANHQVVGLQEKPQVAALADGGFVVVWESENQDGDGDGIFAQRFAADGTKLAH